jgi:hypothetical protein
MNNNKKRKQKKQIKKTMLVEMWGTGTITQL